MKILLSSHFFHPSVGGIEEVSYTLAHEFVRAGHEVRVVTSTRKKSAAKFPFEIVRRPGPARLLSLVRWCDVYFHNNISLQTAWPLLFIRKPWVIAHHTWIARMDGRHGIRDWLKQLASKYATNITISEAVAEHLRTPSVRIGNPYRDTMFKLDSDSERSCDLVFLGRLVWDKGCDLLLDALRLLKQESFTPHLTVIGDGPERPALERQADELGLSGQVDFTGTRTGADLVALLNRHKIMVIPSRWQEPFGLIALEGIACGCVAIGAKCGGLPDAIGSGGITFPCQDVPAMARSIREMLENKEAKARCRAAAPEHLRSHSAEVVAGKYLAVLEGALK